MFVWQSGCFGMVNRGGTMQSREMERAMADQSELQEGSNLGKAEVKAADYFLEPNIVTANHNSGGGGGAFGGWGRAVGAIAGGIDVKKGKATVTLSIVNARTTGEEALMQGDTRKTDWSWAREAAALPAAQRAAAIRMLPSGR